MAEKLPTQKNEPTRSEQFRDGEASKQPNAQQAVVLDDSEVAAVYANFCRISGTPEELVLDFALNTQSHGTIPDRMKLNQRVILNFYTAKRLLGALHMAVQRHETAFRTIETDVRRRVSERE